MACNHYKECMFYIKTIGIQSARFASRPFCSAKQSVGFRYLHYRIILLREDKPLQAEIYLLVYISFQVVHRFRFLLVYRVKLLYIL